LSARQRRPFQSALLGWYRQYARPLRIRTTRDAWPVLVAEVMAQQTQIVRVDDAWVGFLERFPTPLALSEASPADVLRAWSGLGYNRRAIHLQRAASVITREHGGRVPSAVEQLESLPGVGPYTARAVAALAFGQPVAAVDTNVRRVVGRLLGRSLTAASLQAEADRLVARHDPATWTHATMELGATLCRPVAPACQACPVDRWCASAGLVAAGRVAADPGRPGVARAATSERPAFEHTTRWLRGRIVAQLRDVEDGAWAHLPEAIGGHGSERIAEATAALQQDGLLEMRADGAVRLPSTTP
jgi:A/G-specific adenine glycosylase